MTSGAVTVLLHAKPQYTYNWAHRTVMVRMIGLILLIIVYQCVSINFLHHCYNATITSSAVDKRAGSNETARPTAALVAL